MYAFIKAHVIWDHFHSLNTQIWKSEIYMQPSPNAKNNN